MEVISYTTVILGVVAVLFILSVATQASKARIDYRKEGGTAHQQSIEELNSIVTHSLSVFLDR